MTLQLILEKTTCMNWIVSTHFSETKENPAEDASIRMVSRVIKNMETAETLYLSRERIRRFEY